MSQVDLATMYLEINSFGLGSIIGDMEAKSYVGQVQVAVLDVAYI
jgi:hypothetical protein